TGARSERSRPDATLLRVASVAAGSAHEVSTQLSTMSVLLKDLRADYTDPQIQEDLALLQEQVRQCKESLQQTVRSAEFHRNQPHVNQPADIWLKGLLERWQLMRPEASWQLKAVPEGEVPLVQDSP